MDTPPVLHAAHDVREALDALTVVSWLVIGIAVGALVLTWGRLLSWLRTPDFREGARLVRWGEDEGGLYFQIAGAADAAWSAEGPDGAVVELAQDTEGLLRCPATAARPAALISSGGVRLTL